MQRQRTQEEIFGEYSAAKRTITPEFLASVNIGAIGPLSFQIRNILTYMQSIEGAVWGVYFKELDRTPTGKNPYVGKFLRTWLEEEGRHAKLLADVLEATGGATPYQVMRQYDTSWIARIFGERLFGGIHMTMGATNELMTRFAYSTFAKSVESDHPELARILFAISREESLHFSYYYKMAEYYLSQSKVARVLTSVVLNKIAVGVGVGVRRVEEAHEVFRALLEKNQEEFRKKVGGRIRMLPGMEGFTAMERLVDRACRA